MAKGGCPSMCCGCDVQTRTLLIAILSILISAGYVLYGIRYLKNLEPEDQTDYIVFMEFNSFWVIMIVFSIFLIIGVTGEVPKLFIPWMVWAVICELNGGILGFVDLIRSSATFWYYVLFFVTRAVRLRIACYCIVTVCECYYDTRMNRSFEDVRAISTAQTI